MRIRIGLEAQVLRVPIVRRLAPFVAVETYGARVPGREAPPAVVEPEASTSPNELDQLVASTIACEEVANALRQVKDRLHVGGLSERAAERELTRMRHWVDEAKVFELKKNMNLRSEQIAQLDPTVFGEILDRLADDVRSITDVNETLTTAAAIVDERRRNAFRQACSVVSADGSDDRTAYLMVQRAVDSRRNAVDKRRQLPLVLEQRERTTRQKTVDAVAAVPKRLVSQLDLFQRYRKAFDVSPYVSNDVVFGPGDGSPDASSPNQPEVPPAPGTASGERATTAPVPTGAQLDDDITIVLPEGPDKSAEHRLPDGPAVDSGTPGHSASPVHRPQRPPEDPDLGGRGVDGPGGF